jgi:hypothetical protein
LRATFSAFSGPENADFVALNGVERTASRSRVS